MLAHPRSRELRRFAHHELSDPGRARLAAHLSGCARCRGEVARFRELRSALHAAADAPPAPDALARVLARRAAGERVILPEEALPAPARRRRWRMAGASAAAAVLVAVVLSTLSAPPADAVSSELRFTPEAPRAGAEVEASYRPGAFFAGLDTLFLRARYRTERGAPYNHGSRQERVAALVRGRDGAFHGRFRLPDPVVYAVFAVEDAAGERVDHRGNRLWELEVHGADGRPRMDALVQRFNDLHGRSWPLMLETAHRMARLHPDDPRGWMYVAVLEQELAAPGARDSLQALHRPRGEALHARLAARARLPEGVVEAMVFYAPTREARQVWWERLVREHPTDPHVLLTRENRLSPRGARRRDPGLDSALAYAAYRDSLEQLWRELPASEAARHAYWFKNVAYVAQDAGDAEAYWRWTERILRHGSLSRDVVIYWLDERARWPALRDRAVSEMRRYLAAWREPDDAERPLTATRREYRRESGRAYRRLLASLGSALLAGGDRSGLDTLRLAAAEGWSSDVFRTTARAALAAGDTAGALRYFALLAAEPGLESYADSARARGGAHFDEVRWSQWVTRARERMSAQTLADASSRPLRGRLAVAGAGGRSHALAELLGGRVSVITFWDHRCGPSVRELPEVEQLHGWLRERGVGLIPVAEGGSPDEVAEAMAVLRRSGVTAPAYFDTRGEVRSALDVFGTPSYWVVDAAGRVVFEQSSLPEVRRQVAALLAASPPRRAER